MNEIQEQVSGHAARCGCGAHVQETATEGRARFAAETSFDQAVRAMFTMFDTTEIQARVEAIIAQVTQETAASIYSRAE